MTKDLNEKAILNELKQGSSFFKTQHKTEKRTFERSNEPTNDRTTEQIEKNNSEQLARRKVRHTFDIYEDQLQALHTLQLKAVQQGKRKPKLGTMVQEAIDSYLKNLPE
ncbi:hypothetical protein [Candidatus Leptofilum sp.]|uniref:hypothetical protein n=1 Tax=Candidatus Leptofilum sp. TaxID=3241576 RepID=UPI003B58C52D